MKTCGLCGLENPDEARFCMKCGNDMMKIQHSEVPPEMLGESATFTPIVNDEYARLAPTARGVSSEPVGDVASYKEAAAAAAAAMEAEQQAALQDMGGGEAPAKGLLWDTDATAAPPDEDLPEIRQTGVTADFSNKQRFCHRCGMANPRDQRFCKNCGSALMQSEQVPAYDPREDVAAMPASHVGVETTYLADVSPASAYAQGDEAPARRRRPSARTLPDWGAKEWLGLIAAALVLGLIVWLFLFGGFGKLFNSKAAHIHKAGGVMEKLPGFKYSINMSFESGETQYPGGGHVLYEQPGNAAWELNRSGPGASKVEGTLQVDNKTYSNGGAGWQPDQSPGATGDVTLMWKDFSSIEALPNAPMGASPQCYHYKYRMNPALFLTALGLGQQDTASDAVMEIWIDTGTFQVVRETTQVFNAQIDGVRSSFTMTMDLVEVGKSYGIKAP